MGFPIFHSVLTRKLSAHPLSFWMTRGHLLSSFSHYPYSFICGIGIILFIGALKLKCLPDQRSDPLFLKLTGKCWQILSPIWWHLLQDNCFQSGRCRATFLLVFSISTLSLTVWLLNHLSQDIGYTFQYFVCSFFYRQSFIFYCSPPSFFHTTLQTSTSQALRHTFPSLSSSSLQFLPTL